MKPSAVLSHFSGRRWMWTALHVAGVVLFLVVPYLLRPHWMRNETSSIPLLSILPFLFPVLIFYLNYLWLVPRLLLPRHILTFLLANLAAFLAVQLLFNLSMPLLPSLPGHHSGPPPGGGFFPLRGLASVFLTILFAASLRILEHWDHVERLRQRIETERLRDELTSLRQQLGPHFLLNTLNNIYSLAAKDPEHVQDAILNLARLMRYLLYEADVEKSKLDAEIAFLKSYVDLMTMRIPTEAKATLHVDCEPGHLRIAPLLLLPLAENAFKHGIHPDRKSVVDMRLFIADRMLVFQVNNTLHPQEGRDHSGSGIGLANLVRRLEMHYAGQYQFRFEAQGDRFLSSLSIPLEE